jgi:molybdate transport system substrate-binding protein
MSLRRTWLWGVVFVLCLGWLMPGQAAAKQELLVFAAASTTNAVTELGKAFEQANKGKKVVNSFAASSTLAKQIEQGAPAGVYVSANLKWMDYLEKKGLLAKGTRANVAANNLVLIAPSDSSLNKVALSPKVDLIKLLGDGRLAMGDPSHVPAGMYGKEALQNLGIWDALRERAAGLATVRAALTLVERGEAPLGIVYGSDAAISKKVKVVGVFPEDSHRPVEYPAAVIVEHDSPLAREYMAFLRTPAASAIFAKYGFRSH